MELLVSDTDVALDSVTVIAVDYGGYIISTHTWYEDDFRYATVRLGVPVEEFENVLRRLRGLALQVLNEMASGEDVTDQFVDLQSRLTNLQATRDRIREFLDKAATVEEALQVNEQLSEVEGQIEEIQGRMNYLKDRAAYSTIDIQLNPERPTPTPSPTPTSRQPQPRLRRPPRPWLPGETFQGATDVLTSIVKGLVDLGIWVLVVLGPFLIVIALVVGLFIVWRRRRMRKEPPPEPPEPDESSLDCLCRICDSDAAAPSTVQRRFSCFPPPPPHVLQIHVRVDRAIVDGPQAGGKALDKVAVVDDGQHGALEAAQALLELLARGDVEVVDRLVEDEQVAARGDQLGQGQARALAQAERPTGTKTSSPLNKK